MASELLMLELFEMEEFHRRSQRDKMLRRRQREELIKNYRLSRGLPVHTHLSAATSKSVVNIQERCDNENTQPQKAVQQTSTYDKAGEETSEATNPHEPSLPIKRRRALKPMSIDAVRRTLVHIAKSKLRSSRLRMQFYNEMLTNVRSIAESMQRIADSVQGVVMRGMAYQGPQG